MLLIPLISGLSFAHAICGGGVDLRCYKVASGQVMYGTYTSDGRGTRSEMIVEGADSKTFKKLPGPAGPGSYNPCTANCAIYGKDKNNVYLRGARLSTPGIDVETFHLILHDYQAYAADKDQVYSYIDGKILKGFDPKSFRWENGTWRDDKKVLSH